MVESPNMNEENLPSFDPSIFEKFTNDLKNYIDPK